MTQLNSLGRLEKDCDRSKDNLTTLTEKLKAAEEKIHDQETGISQLQRNILSLEQSKTTLQLQYADILQVLLSTV